MSGIMNSLYARVHSHPWAEAGKIECLGALEKQVAGGERKNHALGF